MSAKKVVDIHTHIIGPGNSGKGCRMSKEFIFSRTFASMLMALKAYPFDVTDERLREILLKVIASSEKIDYAVLLAIDGVYKNNKYVESESHIVISNDYVMDIAKTDKRVLFGASVHPYREAREMLAETMRCINAGAVLFNWMPSWQQIDPEDDRCVPFYFCLAKERVPLLCHTGAEFIAKAEGLKVNRYVCPAKLKRALDIGVRVIVAHCSVPHGDSNPDADKKYFVELMEMLRESDSSGWGLYADLSAFCTPERRSYLEVI